MNGSARERLSRYLDYPDDVDQPPILNETLGGLVRPDWLAISHCPESASGPEAFVLYFLATAGEIIACIQRDTLEAALDEALSLTGLSHDRWTVCDVPIREGTSLHRCIITSEAAEGRTK